METPKSHLEEAVVSDFIPSEVLAAFVETMIESRRAPIAIEEGAEDAS